MVVGDLKSFSISSTHSGEHDPMDEPQLVGQSLQASLTVKDLEGKARDPDGFRWTISRAQPS